MARGSDERNLFMSFTSDQGGLSCKGFEALSKLKQSHIKIYFCIFLDCSQLNIYLPFNFNFSKPTSRYRHNADFKYNCVHLKQIHQNICVKSSSTINRQWPTNRAYFSKRQFLEMARLGYFLWITGSLKVSIISSLVEKETKFLADSCTSPSKGKKSTACE